MSVFLGTPGLFQRAGSAFVWLAPLAPAARLARAPAVQQIADIEGITEYRQNIVLLHVLLSDSSTSNVTVHTIVFVASQRTMSKE